MNNQDKQQLLERAEREYYSGIAFKRPSILSDELDECFRHEICVSTGDWEASDNQDGNGLFIHNSETCCYFAGQWAEIVSKPEETDHQGNPMKYWGGKDSHLLKSDNPHVDFNPTPKPLDIEKDQRYLDLLDEESLSLYKIHYDFLIRQYWSDSEQDNKVKLSAQRRYFEEKLQYKDAKISSWKDLYNKFESGAYSLANRVIELTATIAKRDDRIQRLLNTYQSESTMRRQSDLTIEQQKKEIEELKDKVVYFEDFQESHYKERENALLKEIEQLNKIISMAIKHFEAIRDWDEDSDRYWQDQGDCSKDALRMIKMDLEKLITGTK